MLDDILQFPRCYPATRTAELDFRRRASQAFVDKILEGLREGVRALLEALMEMDA